MSLLCSWIFVMILSVKGQCSIEQFPTSNGVCSADILCLETTENVENLIGDWSCINRIEYDYYDYKHIKIDDNYDLYINIVNNTNLVRYTSVMENIRRNVKKLVVEGGNLLSLGISLTKFPKLTNFSFTYNKVENINLQDLSGDSMTIANVSHNYISSIEVTNVGSTAHSSITIIDLSYNTLESIPNNCFTIFSNLKYLDLSYNNIKRFDILTFEGIAQLETLKISFNKIFEIGQNFARFVQLKVLNLDNNQLTSLTDLNFRTLINLKNLNLSSNLIKNIEDQTLGTLTNLAQLDLSHNKIIGIRQSLFKNNKHMNTLSLSHNAIENIEGGAFNKTNISNFDILYNNIRTIEYDTFLGISVESLDLNNGRLKKLGDNAFSALGPVLGYLNLSTNLIENIEESAFRSLKKLCKLDLSYNNLINIDIDTSDLTELKEYYLRGNKIEKVTLKMLVNLTSLEVLDLSQNEIIDIEVNSFDELKNVKVFSISNNKFILRKNIFQGLRKVKTLDLSNTRLISCHNESFFGMVSLTYLNLSNSQLDSIEYETFKETGAIKILDLSHNLLDSFLINTSSISLLSHLYLNHNKFINITGETFSNLHRLEKLSLACNNIFHIDSSALQKTSHLQYLDLFSNYNLHILGEVFDNLDLGQVSLQNVKQYFNFKNAINVTIMKLVLSNCEINDINSVFVYKIRNVFQLDISANKIKTLDKGSLQDMTVLNWLNISFNMISNIQPGTFLSNKMINTLDLYSNKLQSLQYGVLDGLSNLRILNLSNNEIHTFGVNLLHNTPYLTELFLENNNLESLNFKAFNETSVQVLTIGGNSIECDALADWRKNNNNSFKYVSAGRPDFISENIYGISCKGKTIVSQKTALNENINVNLTKEVIEIKQIVGQLYKYIKVSLNDTNNKDNNLNNEAISNTSRILFNEQLNHILIESKNLSDSVAKDIKLMISLLEKNNNLTELGNIHEELSQLISISNKPTELNEKQISTDVQKAYDRKSLEVKLESKLATIKILLFFVSVCFAFVILFRVVAVVYKCFNKNVYKYRTGINSYDNGQLASNGLELE